MAGSYNHIVNDEGQLLSNKEFVGMIENLGDAYEMAEEMYGMIWFLAVALSKEHNTDVKRKPTDPDILVKMAAHHYKNGIERSPTNRPAQF